MAGPQHGPPSASIRRLAERAECRTGSTCQWLALWPNIIVPAPRRLVRIDREHLEAMRAETHPTAVLLIRFFGYCDPRYPQAVAIDRRSGAVALEHKVHAMYSDLVEVVVAASARALRSRSIKVLPVPPGGVLVVNPQSCYILKSLVAPEVTAREQWDHDHAGVAARRRQNSVALTEPLAVLADHINPVHQELDFDDRCGLIAQFPCLAETIAGAGPA